MENSFTPTRKPLGCKVTECHQWLHQSVAGECAVLQTASVRRPCRGDRNPHRLSEADGDIFDWIFGWDQWTSMSAITGQARDQSITAITQRRPAQRRAQVNPAAG